MIAHHSRGLPKRPTPLSLLRARAAEAGLADPICSGCGLFEPDGEEMMGACRRTGEIQTKYGICLSWTLSHEVPPPPPPRPRPSPTVLEDGSISLFAKAERPVSDVEPKGQVHGMICAEPGCDGRLMLRVSYKINRRFYGCEKYPACKGTLPADADGSPRGLPRPKVLQAARNEAHKVFDRLWKEKHVSRGGAYSWMQKVMGLAKDDAHIGLFEIGQCHEIVAHVDASGPGTDFWVAWVAARPKSKRRRSKK
jgi:hypothetical protein